MSQCNTKKGDLGERTPFFSSAGLKKKHVALLGTGSHFPAKPAALG